MVILHICDLHFGVPTPTAEIPARKLALDSLGEQLVKLEDNWRPTAVLIGGDLSWSGSSEEFDRCGDWLQTLLGKLELPKSALAACAGNHDVSRQSIRIPRPATSAAADAALSVPFSADLVAPFENYVSFCRGFGIASLNIGTESSHLVGVRRLEQCNLVVLNTGWFCRDQDDRGQLWLGYPLLATMTAAGQLASGTELATAPPTIALLHHPFEWLNDSELNAYTRPNTRDYLAARVHLMLSGHIHGEPRLADRIAGAAYHLRGGAAYESAYYPNSVNLIRTASSGFEVRTYQYDFRDPTHAWVAAGNSHAQGLLFAVGASALRGLRPHGTVSLQELRKASGEFSASLVESRSRLVTPEAVPHLVDVGVTFAKRSREPWVKERQRQPVISLAAAIAESRRLLITGDLGSGKTTLAARFVSRLSAEPNGPLPVLLPARVLTVVEGTTGDFIESLSKSVSGEIAPSLSPVSLRALFDDGVETLIIIDGIDEVGIRKATEILHFLDRIVASWPNVSTIATTRPVEGASFDLSGWDVVATAPMDYVEWRELFASEARAAGLATNEAKSQADILAERVRRTSALANLARTPLGSRLLSRSLLRRDQSSAEPTLGDLLFELVEERVWTWALRASRPRTTRLFEDSLPDAASRSRVLGRLALATRNAETITLTQAYDALSGLLSVCNVDSRTLAREAIDFFEIAGLLEIHNDRIAFGWKALYQFLVGIGLAEAVRTGQRSLLGEPAEAWREVAFAAATLRRWANTGSGEVGDYILQVLAPAQSATQACYVVTEFKSAALATTLFQQMARFGWRPLSVDWDEWLEPARIVAQAMTLAGDTGFEWFFKEYLAPEDPWIHAGSKLPEDIFQSWVLLQRSSATPLAAHLLDSLVRPHVVAESIPLIGLIPHIALLRPDAFSVVERAWFISQLLEEGAASSGRAAPELESIAKGGSGEVVRRVLEERCWRSPSGSARAAGLWFELFEGVPPLSVLRAAVAAHRGPRHIDSDKPVREMAERRLGNDNWLAFCRWSLLSRDTHLAAGAALELHTHGELRLGLIGESLVGGLHDGGYFERAEEVLHVLVQREGHDGVAFLAGQMERLGTDAMSGSHSAMWRILLKDIGQLRQEAIREVVTAAAWSLGPFILPRYSEIRLALRRAITEGPHSEEISRTLYDLLHSSELRLRHNAAAILLAAGERGVEPVLALADTLPLEERGSWWEWQDYFVSLHLEPSVLSALRNATAKMSERSAQVVFRLLRKNGVSLTRDEVDRFVTVGLERHWNLATEVRDGDPVVQEILAHRLRQGSAAAARCLVGHLAKDSDDDLDSLLLAVDGSFYKIRPFMAAVERMRVDAEFAARIAERAARLMALEKGNFTLDLVRSALGSPEEWETVIWRIVGGGERMLGVEDDDVQVILRIGRIHADLRDSLCAAVTRLLTDPSLTSRNVRARQWLLLLADEFGDRSVARMDQALRLHSVNDDRIRAAFVARFMARGGSLSEVPLGRADGVASVPVQWRSQRSVQADLRGWITKRLWDSEGLDETFLLALEQLVAYSSMPTSELPNLAASGDVGTLVAAVMAVCFGYVDQGTAPSLIPKGEPFLRRGDDSMTYHLSRGWRAYVDATASIDSVRAKYLTAIEAAFGDPAFDRPLLLSLMHRLGQLPSSQQLATAITEWSNAQTTNDSLVIAAAASALSKENLSDEDRRQLLAAIHAALGQFASQGNQWGRRSVLRQLGVPLLQWRFGAREYDALALEVFAQGFVSMFEPSTVSNVEDVFEALSPLVEGLSPDALGRVLRSRDHANGRLARAVGWLVQALITAIPSRPNGTGTVH